MCGWPSRPIPWGFLNQVAEGRILDEIQRLPSLLSYLQGMVDKDAGRGRFILTGSHQPQLHQAISQSLAGRTASVHPWPFSFHELREYQPVLDPFGEICRRLVTPGLSKEGLETRRFYNSYLQTYVERDLRAMIQLRDLSQFQKFLTLLAGGGPDHQPRLAFERRGRFDHNHPQLALRCKASYVVFELPPLF